METKLLVTTVLPESTSSPKALLDAANSASEKVAALHIAFLALCTYVLVIVFSTTDMDLLVGKGIKLPVADVQVPIVGFYATAPYLLVLVHFNLLLQLQLLSRKLFAFDAAAPEREAIGGLHDQLNIFPYNYYLVGRPNPLVRGFVALLVTITVLVLPLLALLTLQARWTGTGPAWQRRSLHPHTVLAKHRSTLYHCRVRECMFASLAHSTGSEASRRQAPRIRARPRAD